MSVYKQQQRDKADLSITFIQSSNSIQILSKASFTVTAVKFTERTILKTAR
jgi:hypothetical protein